MREKLSDLLGVYGIPLIILAGYLVSLHHKASVSEAVIGCLIQTAILYPAIAGLILLSICGEWNLALGEVTAFGICLSSLLNSHFGLSFYFCAAVLLVCMVIVGIIFSRLHRASGAGFLWLSLAISAVLSEINGLLRRAVMSVNENTSSAGNATDTAKFFQATTGMPAVFLLLTLLTFLMLFFFLNKTYTGRSLSTGMIGTERCFDDEQFVSGTKEVAFVVSLILAGITASLCFLRTRAVTMVQGEYLHYSFLSVIGLCVPKRINRISFLPRTLLGSLAYVMLQTLLQQRGWGRRENIIIGGGLFLYGLVQGDYLRLSGRKGIRHGTFRMIILVSGLTATSFLAFNRLAADSASDSCSVRIVMPTLSLERESAIADSMETYLKKYGFQDVTCLSYEQDSMRATEIINNCIADGCDILCFYPSDEGAQGMQKLASEKGIGVFLIGSGSPTYDYLVQVDNQNAGKIIAETAFSWMQRNQPAGSQIAVMGTNVNRYLSERTEAMNERLMELVGDKYEIIESGLLDGTGLDSVSYVSNLLNRYPELKAIVAYDDGYALSAAEALKVAGRQDVGVFGCGGTRSVMQMIAAGGPLQGTVLLGDSARKWADAVYAWTKGRLGERSTGYTFSIPVTKDNVSFHIGTS